MSEFCPVCEAAKTRTTTGGVYMLNCPGCNVRKIANAPKHIREQAYAQIEDAAEREAFKRAVEAEFRRVHGFAA